MSGAKNMAADSNNNRDSISKVLWIGMPEWLTKDRNSLSEEEKKFVDVMNRHDRETKVRS